MFSNILCNINFICFVLQLNWMINLLKLIVIFVTMDIFIFGNKLTLTLNE